MASYTDLPDGATILHDPGQAVPASQPFSDLPDGAQVVKVPMAAAQQPLDWGTRLKSLFGDPTAQQQVLAASTAAVRNSPVGGIAMGLSDPVYGVRQLATHGLASALPNPTTQGWAQSADQAAQQAEQNYQQNWRQGNTGTDWGRIVGQGLATLPLASAMPVGASLLGRAASGAASGAVSGGLQPVNQPGDYWSQKGTQAAQGAVAGGLTAPVVGAIAGAISPNLRPGAQQLLDNGVKLTPGQLLGGTPNLVEQAMSSVPLIGGAIKEGRQATVEEFNRGAISQALAPIGETLEAKGAGHEAISEMQDKISKAYTQAADGLGIHDNSSAAMQLATGLRTIYQNSVNMLPDRAQQFQTILKNQVLDRLSQQGGLSPADFQAAKSSLGQMGSNFLHSSSADERDLGQTLLQVQNVLKSALRTSNPQAADALDAADAAYAMSRRVQGAAVKAPGGEPGVFSAQGLQSSIRQQDPTAGKRAFAAGDALMQPYAEAGRTILGSTLPDSGTPFRQAVQHGTGGLAGLLGAHELSSGLGIPFYQGLIPILGAYGAAKAAYSPLGRQIMGGLLAARPAMFAPVANAVRGAVPALSMTAPGVYQGLLATP